MTWQEIEEEKMRENYGRQGRKRKERKDRKGKGEEGKEDLKRRKANS